MTDLISRADAIETIAEFLYYSFDYIQSTMSDFSIDDWEWKIKGVLSNLPSAQPQTPCDMCLHNPPSSMDALLNHMGG